MEYLFVRADCFYFVDLRDDEDAVRNAVHNPGTLQVEAPGRIVWKAVADA